MSQAEEPAAAGALAVASLDVPADARGAFEDALTALEPGPVSVSAVPIENGVWRVEALFDRMPAPGEIASVLEPVADALDMVCPRIAVDPLPERDWVAESLRALGPVEAGRFRVIGSHLADGPRSGTTLLVEAGPAFGSGHHETTRGCLLALDWLARGRRPARVLDLGCGSGVLALAAAAAFRTPVLAADIDAAAVRTARENARLNGLGPWVQATQSDGFENPALRRAGPFDLVLANILAEPLKALALEIARHLAPDGILVLSGLLAHQETAVRAAYRAWGLVPLRRFTLGNWPTLALSRPVRSHAVADRRARV